MIGAALTLSLALAAAALSASARTGAAPKKIDTNATIRVGYIVPTPSTLDPAFSSSFVYPVAPMFDRLTQLGPLYNELLPELADSWAFAKDGSSLTLHLHPGVKFHDGSPVDATAVKANLQRYQTAPGSKQAVSLTAIASMKVVNKTTLRLNLVKGQGASLPYTFASWPGMIVNPKYFNNPQLATNPPAGAGSGPYILKSRPTATEFDYVRAPGTPWESGTGTAKNLIVFALLNGETAINAYRAGQLDVVELTGDVLTEGQSLLGGDTAGTPYQSNAPAGIVLNPKVPPLNNLYARKAIASAIDVKAYSNALFQGNCAPNPQPVAPANYTHAAKFVNANPYSLANARADLVKAGMPNGFTFERDVYNFSFLPTASQIIQGQLAAVGITETQHLLDLATWATSNAAGKWGSNHLASITSDPQDALMQTLLLGGPSIVVGTPLEAQARTFNTLLSNPARSTAQRKATFAAFYKWLNEQAIVVNTCQQEWMFLHKKNIINAGPKWPSGLIDARYFAATK